ncbi:MAG: hypothetical protein GY820_35465 [Gammaproteobacteria bacterium]|nr:hypothetical protein [Gammaproteobacteria bacterium]
MTNLNFFSNKTLRADNQTLGDIENTEVCLLSSLTAIGDLLGSCEDQLAKQTVSDTGWLIQKLAVELTDLLELKDQLICCGLSED